MLVMLRYSIKRSATGWDIIDNATHQIIFTEDNPEDAMDLVKYLNEKLGDTNEP
jgi:hypothetical protein